MLDTAPCDVAAPCPRADGADEPGAVPLLPHVPAGPETKPERRGGLRNPPGGRPRKPVPEPIAIQSRWISPRWCVVAFRGQAEISATGELARLGYTAYLPLIAIRRRDAALKTVPLFPGYGFVQLGSTDPFAPILATHGVREILRAPDGRPALVPCGLVERLHDGDEERLQLPAEAAPILPVGTRVRAERGPFGGFPGDVLACDGYRTQVGIEIFGRVTPVWLDRADVSPL